MERPAHLEFEERGEVNHSDRRKLVVATVAPLQQPHLKTDSGAALVTQWFSTTFGLGCDPGDLGLSPASGSLHRACFSPSACVSACLSVMNKIFKKIRKHVYKILWHSFHNILLTSKEKLQRIFIVYHLSSKEEKDIIEYTHIC